MNARTNTAIIPTIIKIGPRADPTAAPNAVIELAPLAKGTPAPAKPAANC